MADFKTKELLDPLKDLVDISKEVVTQAENLNKEFTKTATLIKKASTELDTTSAKGLKDFNEQLVFTNDLVTKKIANDKELLKAEKSIKVANNQKLKIEKQLNDANDESVKGKIRFQALQREQKQLLQAEIILQNKQVTSLKDLKEQNKALKIARDRLDYREDADQIKEYNDQIDANTEILKGNSDQTAAAKYDVGKYREEVGKAIEENLNLKGSFGVLGSILGVLQNQFVKVRDEQKKQEEQTEANVKGFKRFGSAAKFAGKALLASGIGAIIAILGEVLVQFKNTRDGAVAFQKQTTKLFTTIKVLGGFAIEFIKIKFSQLSDEFDKASLKLERIALQIQESFSFGDKADDLKNKISEVTKEIDKTSESSLKAKEGLSALYGRDLTDEIDKAVNSATKLVDSQFKLGDATKYANIEIAKQRAIEEELLSIADDDTRGFNERNIARLELLDTLESSNSATTKAVDLAKQQVDIQREAISLELQTAGISSSKISQLLSASSLTQALIDDQKTLGKLSVNSLDLIAEAEVNFIEKQSERTQQLIETGQTLNKVLFDEVEQRVDFLIDGNDQIKSSNEKLINDEKLNLETRKKILQDTQDLISKSNREVQKEIARTVEGLEGSDIAKAFADAISPEDLNEKLKTLGLAEIPINRLLELYREIQTQSRDFADSTIVLAESNARLEELNKDIAAQRSVLNNEEIKNADDLNKELERLANERFDNKVEQLRKEIELLEGGSVTKAEKEKELNDLLLDQKKDQLAEIDKLDDENSKKRKEALKEVFDFAETLAIKLNERRQDALQRELDANLRNQEIIQRGIESGSELGEASLAQEKKVQAEREAELIRLENKALQLKAFIAILEVWGQTGDIGTAAAGFASAKNLAQTADGAFYEGTDYVGEGQEVKVHNGKDGYRAALNTGEIVFNNKEADEARELGFGKRDSIMSLMRMASTGVSGGSVSVQVNDNSKVIEQLNRATEAIKALPSQMSTHNTGLTDDPRYIEEVVKKGNITNKAKRRANGTWA